MENNLSGESFSLIYSVFDLVESHQREKFEQVMRTSKKMLDLSDSEKLVGQNYSVEKTNGEIIISKADKNAGDKVLEIARGKEVGAY